MELTEAVRSRRMVRAFTTELVEPSVLDHILDLARRAPSAGHTQGTDLLVLDQPAARARYWDTTLPVERRNTFAWPGLLDAPVLVVVWVSADAYVDRYGEPDKTATGLGTGSDAWTVPYWFVDGGMVAGQLLLAAVDAGLGACLFGLFEHEPAVRSAFSVPAAWRAVGTIALGHPAPDRPGQSAARPRRPLADVVHRDRW